MDRFFGKVGLDGHVQRNRLRLAFLFVGFLGAALLVCLPMAGLVTLFFDHGHSFLREPKGFLLKYAPITMIAASAFFLLRWWRFPVAVGARLAVDNGTPACRRIQRLVKELAALNGLPEPRAVMLDSVALNAFAAGLGRRDATVIVTTGLEGALTDAELKAVLAHEMAHLAFGDTKVMAASAVMVETVDAMRRFVPWRNGLGWKTGVVAILLPFIIPLGVLLTALSAIADTISRGSRLIVAASREMIADAEAIRMTRDPAALVSALRKIDGRSGIGTFPRAIEAMMIDGLASGADATHPTVGERIRAIVDLTGAYFPMPAVAAAPMRPAAPWRDRRPARTVFGLATGTTPAKQSLAQRVLAETAFGRVREGQGRIVKKTRGFQIAVSVGVGLFALGAWSAFSTVGRLPERQRGATPDAATFARAVAETTRDAYDPQRGVFLYGKNGRVSAPASQPATTTSQNGAGSEPAATEMLPLRGSMPPGRN